MPHMRVRDTEFIIDLTEHFSYKKKKKSNSKWHAKMCKLKAFNVT